MPFKTWKLSCTGRWRRPKLKASPAPRKLRCQEQKLLLRRKWAGVRWPLPAKPPLVSQEQRARQPADSRLLGQPRRLWAPLGPSKGASRPQAI